MIKSGVNCQFDAYKKKVVVICEDIDFFFF